MLGGTAAVFRSELVAADEMPRTDAGKILHRVLRERYGRG
jgi:acyl-coenzyme A synthetase/AMP-(fatty) acid ligase